MTVQKTAGRTVADASVPHNYPLAIRDSGLSSSIGLVLGTLPYALMRFATLFAFSGACIVWIVVMIGGSVWLSSHIAGAFGAVWFICCLLVAGWFWTAILRYVLHLIECGHVAVLTELIVYGKVGNGTESMFAYGKRIVTERFAQVNVLFAMNVLVRGVVNAVHRMLEGIGSMLPVPGLETIANVLTAVLRAATRYMDKVIFSYTLACNTPNPWQGSRDGVVYYAQNAKPILKTSVWIVICEHVLSLFLWLLLLAPAAMLTAMLPHSVRQMGGVITAIIAILCALAARAAFVKPIFLVMIMVRFHALIEHQAINQDWVTRLDQLSDKFRNLGNKAQNYVGTPAAPAAGSNVPVA